MLNPEPTHGTLKDNLISNIIYDDPAVFRRLRVDDIKDDFVVPALISLKTALAEDIHHLMQLAESSSKNSLDDLQADEVNDRTWGDDYDVEEEVEIICAILVRLFAHTAKFNPTSRSPSSSPHRTFQMTHGLLPPNEPHTFGFPNIDPSIILSPHGGGSSHSKTWQDRDAFAQVEMSKHRGPKPMIEGTIPNILLHSAAYAGLFMSARPFMLFCTGFLVFGTEFCVGIFDREGITFSPIFDMFEDMEVLIRVVRSLTCNLSIEELGLDPTVRVLTDKESLQLTGENEYPSIVVPSVGNDPREWCTIGPPLWTSPEVLGHGLHTWLVRELVEGDSQQPYLSGHKMILRTSWRSSLAPSESDIYLSIEQPSTSGLAKFECGDDVFMFVGPARYPVTVRNLRSVDSDEIWLRNSDSSPTLVLRRLVLSPAGRPLWTYMSDCDLLTGFRDAIKAHKILFEKGILHRDISAANVLLTETSDGWSRGFIAGLQFARFDNTQGPTIKNDATIPIGIQFMARSLLLHLNPVEPEAACDLESFIWVLSYSVMRNLLYRASTSTISAVRAQYDELRSMFDDTFGGQMSPTELAARRQFGCIALTFSEVRDIKRIVGEFMSGALVALFRELDRLVYTVRNPVVPTALTHDDLLEKVDAAITMLA